MHGGVRCLVTRNDRTKYVSGPEQYMDALVRRAYKALR